MSKVICISGKAGHGKNTLAEMLKLKFEKLGYRTIVIGYGDFLKFVCENYFGWDGKKDQKGRDMLQNIGTDIGRNNHDCVWIDMVKAFIKGFKSEFDIFIIPDCRFENEILEMKKEFDVTTIKVIRLGYENKEMTEEQKQHISETQLDNFIFDKTFINLNFDDEYSFNAFWLKVSSDTFELIDLVNYPQSYDFMLQLDLLIHSILGGINDAKRE